MTLRVEPIVSSRQITYSVITNAIEKKIREAVSYKLTSVFGTNLIFIFIRSMSFWLPPFTKILHCSALLRSFSVVDCGILLYVSKIQQNLNLSLFLAMWLQKRLWLKLLSSQRSRSVQLTRKLVGHRCVIESQLPISDHHRAILSLMKPSVCHHSSPICPDVVCISTNHQIHSEPDFLILLMPIIITNSLVKLVRNSHSQILSKDGEVGTLKIPTKGQISNDELQMVLIFLKVAFLPLSPKSRQQRIRKQTNLPHLLPLISADR